LDTARIYIARGVAVDALNIAVGLTSLGLAVLSIILSLKWANEATRSLDRSNAALDEVRRETANVTRAVEDRLRDVIDRLLPSTEDRFAGEAMSAMLSGSLDIEKLEKLAQLAQQVPARPGGTKKRR
jgi:hypothetical protein